MKNIEGKISYQHTSNSVLSWIKVDVLLGILTTIVSIASLPLIIKNLGMDSYGDWVFVSSIVGFASLLTIGVNISVVKFLGETTDAIKFTRVCNSAIFAQLFVAVALGIIALAVTCVLILLDYERHIVITFTVLGISASLSSMSGPVVGIFSAIGKGVVAAKVSGVGQLFANVAVVAASFYASNIILLAVAQMAVLILVVFYFYFILRKYIGHNLCTEGIDVRKFIRAGRHLQTIHIAEVFTTNWPPIFIHSVFGSSFVSIYAALIKLPTVLGNSLIMKIVSATYPFLMNAWNRNKIRYYWRLYTQAQYLSLTWGFGLFIFFLLTLKDIFNLMHIPSDNMPFWSGVAAGLLALRETFMRSAGIFIIGTGDYNYAKNLALIDAFVTIMTPIVMLKAGLLSVFIGPLLSMIICYTLIEYHRSRFVECKIHILNSLRFIIMCAFYTLCAIGMFLLFKENIYFLIFAIVAAGLSIEYWRYRIFGLACFQRVFRMKKYD